LDGGVGRSWAELGDEQLALVFVEPELAPAEGYTGDDVNTLEGWPQK